MQGSARVRLSKPISATALVVGIVFVIIGLFVVIPAFGAFGVFWTLAALAIAGYHGFNLFSERGVAHEIVEFDTSSQTPVEKPNELSPEQRLRRLDELKRESLLNDEEYREQRERILDEL